MSRSAADAASTEGIQLTSADANGAAEVKEDTMPARRFSQPDGERPKPVKAEAWEYFRTHTLPRYQERKKGDYRKMEPGEEGGQLYDVIWTPLRQLGDFGLGVGLFFQLLVILAILLCIIGCINAWSISYMSSGSRYGGEQASLKLILHGSASCNDSELVCMNAECSETGYRRPCELTLTQGYLDFVSILLLIVVLTGVGHFQDKSAEEMDESEQTAQDYSIVVQDPDPDATDPEEWRKFFERFGHVSYVTVAINNRRLIEALAVRRSILRGIHITSKSNTEELRAIDYTQPLQRDEPLPWWRAMAIKAGYLLDVVAWQQKLITVEGLIDDLSAPGNVLHAVKVFVIFEREEYQRKCLHAMTTGLIPAMTEKADHIPADLRFRGTNVLKVDEAAEPGEVQWRWLQMHLRDRAKLQSASTAVATVVVVLAGLLVWGFSTVSSGWAAIVISINNTVLPVIMKVCNGFERHHTDSNQQASLMFKIVLAQWMNTAFIIYIIKPQTDILDSTYVTQVSSILWADAFTSPVILLVDGGGRLGHYVFSNLANTQLEMNSFFQGTAWFLAERYAAMIKTLFVCLFFSAIFPTGYFISSIAMIISYWVCKYCLLRMWKCPPALDDSLTRLSRYYIALAILIKILVTLHIYAGWPFDNMCVTDALVTGSLPSSVTDTSVYESCTQAPRHVWLPRVHSWMTSDQDKLVRIYRIFGIICTVIFALIYFGHTGAYSIYRLFKGVYKPVGDSQNHNYSEVEEIQAYIPQVTMAGLPHPLLAVDLKHINTENISWTGAYDDYCLCSAKDLGRVPAERRPTLFSPCVYYPPPDKAGVGNGDGGNGGEVVKQDGIRDGSGTVL